MENLTLRTTQINLLDCVHPLMDDPFEMKIFLTTLVKFIEMNIIDEFMVNHDNPHAFRYNPIEKDRIEHGITGQVILVESHIAAHSWPNRMLLNVVITSCKEYSAKDTAIWISKYCESKVYEYNSMCF